MKKFFKSFMLIAAAAVAFSSCQEKIAPVTPDEGIHVIVSSNGVVEYINTKTAVEEGANGTYVKWLSDDAIDVFEAVNGTFQKFSSNSTELKADTETGEADVLAEFGVTFGETRTGSVYTYTAVYPAGAVTQNSDKTFYRFMIPGTQELLNGNLAAGSDVLIGQPINRDTRVSEGEKLSYRFYRPGTVVRLRLKGIVAGEKIQEVKVTAPDGVKFIGYSKVDLTTGKVTESGYSNTGNAVILKTNDLVATGDDYLYFRTLSCEWESGATVSVNVETNKAYYNKEDITLTRNYVFAEEGFTAFGFNVADCREAKSVTTNVYELVTDASDLSAGDEIIIAVKEKTVALGTGYAKDNEAFSKVDIAFNSDGAIDNVPRGVAVLTLGGEAGAWTFENDGNFINATAKNKIKWDASAGSWNISITESKAKITYSNDSYGWIQYNSSSPRFTTYTSSQILPEIYKLQDSRTPLAELIVTATPNHSAKSIKVEWTDVEHATNYTVSCTGQESVDVNPGVGEYTFTSLEFGEYTVTVVANPEDGYKASKASDTATIVDQTPSITVLHEVNITCEEAFDKEIAVTFKNVDLDYVSVNVYKNQACTEIEDDWITVDFNTAKTAILYTAYANEETTERTVYIKVEGLGIDGETEVSEVITLTQDGFTALSYYYQVPMFDGNGQYIIAAQNSNIYAMTVLAADKKYGYLPSSAVTVDAGRILSNGETNALAWTVASTAIPGQYTIKGTDNRYLYQQGTYNSFNVTDNASTVGTAWTSSMRADGKVNITNVSVNKSIQMSTANNNTYGSYSTSDNVFPSLYKYFETFVPVSDISLKSSTSIVEGQSETLSASVLPAEASIKSVIWASDNEAVATVNQNGVVTAKKAGNANIKATAFNNTISATCAVIVTEAPKYDINVSGFTSDEGTVTISDNLTQAPAGTNITVTVTAKPGYDFKSVTLDGVTKTLDSNKQFTFVMPDANVSIVATFDAASTKKYTLVLTSSDIAAVGSGKSGYEKYNGDQTWTAKAADGSTMEVKAVTYQVMPQSNKIQLQKSKGYIYNTTNLGSIESVTLETATNTTTTIGSSQNPTTAVTGGGYFKINATSGGTPATAKITIVFTK